MSKKLMRYEIQGNETGETLVLVHGWPDDATLWKHQLPDLLEGYRCVVVTLPNFGDTKHESGGCSIPEIMQRLKNTIDAVQPEGTISLMAHDWGAVFAYSYEKNHPERVRRMVTLDVGGDLLPTPKEFIFMVFYQWTLISCWFIGGISTKTGTNLAKRFAGLIGTPPEHQDRIQSRSIHVYFHYWRMALFPFFSMKHLLFNYQPACPTFYIWGEDKPLRFHSQRWLDRLESGTGKILSIPDGQHWFMDTHHERINPLILDWLNETEVE